MNLSEERWMCIVINDLFYDCTAVLDKVRASCIGITFHPRENDIGPSCEFEIMVSRNVIGTIVCNLDGTGAFAWRASDTIRDRGSFNINDGVPESFMTFLKDHANVAL